MSIFINQAEHRPRAGWRICLQFTLFLLFAFFLFPVISGFGMQDMNLYKTLIYAIAAILSILISAKFIDKRPFTSYGLHINPVWRKELLAGLVIGTAAMSIIFLVEWVAGWVIITGFGWERASSTPYPIWLAGYFFAMVMIGFYEELLFRGYQVLNLAEGFGSQDVSPAKAAAAAIAISSVIFGLLHAGNPNASWVSTMSIMLAGAVLALPYLLTGRLALSIGLHISWNFVQGGIWGLPVSGNLFRGSVLQLRQDGPFLLTGGHFGPEAGLLGIGGFFIMLVLVYIFLRESDPSTFLQPALTDTPSISGKTHEQGS